MSAKKKLEISQKVVSSGHAQLAWSGQGTELASVNAGKLEGRSELETTLELASVDYRVGRKENNPSDLLIWSSKNIFTDFIVKIIRLG